MPVNFLKSLFSEKKIHKKKAFWVVVVILLAIGGLSNDKKSTSMQQSASTETAITQKSDSSGVGESATEQTNSYSAGNSGDSITSDGDGTAGAQTQQGPLAGWYQLACVNGPVFGESIPERRIDCGDRQRVEKELYAAYEWLRGNSSLLNDERYENACFDSYNKAKELDDMVWDKNGSVGAMYIAECANSGLVSAVHKLRGW